MSGFNFHSVGSLLIEDGASTRLGPMLAAKYKAKRVFLVTDKGLQKIGLVAPVLAALKASGLVVEVYDDVAADPSEMIVDQAVTAAKAFAADVVVGFGGGSSMDVAKLVAILLSGKQSLADIYGLDKVLARETALVQVPTTAGTGSEVTPIAIITTKSDTKMGIVDPHLLADLAVLDATLTVGLPSHITAATGIDAMVHAIEAYTSILKKNPMSDALARQALRLLGDNIVTACKDGQDIDARRAMLTGAMMAGVAFTNAPVAAVHALAYPLGGRFHITHGLSNALVLPYVLRFNAPIAGPLYAELADVMGLEGKTEAAKTEAFIDWLEGIANDTGIERKLRQLNIEESDIEMLAEDAMLQTRLLVNNPRPVTLADARAIYEAAW